MAAALLPLNYRTFDELLDSVRIDLGSYQQAGDIDAANLIKIAQAINYELGLKIHMAKETVIDIEHHRAKLPADFHQLQLALLCHHYKYLYYPIGPGADGALQLYEQPPVYLPNTQSQLTTCPCWTISSFGAQCPVTYCDGTQDIVYFPPNDDGTAKVTKLCALVIDTSNVHPSSQITVTTSSFCYNDINNGGFTCTEPAIPCYTCPMPTSCGIDGDPFKGNLTRSICDGTIDIKVVQGCGTQGKVRCYERFERVHILPHKQTTSFCPNNKFTGCGNTASIIPGFIETSVECGKMYISYMGALEDDMGNLLVLDHPKINLYYEAAITYTIMKWLYINGEADIERRLALVKQERDDYRQQALSIANTPNYREVIQSGQIIRDMAKRRFSNPIDRWHGYLGFANNIDTMDNGNGWR